MHTETTLGHNYLKKESQLYDNYPCNLGFMCVEGPRVTCVTPSPSDIKFSKSNNYSVIHTRSALWSLPTSTDNRRSRIDDCVSETPL